MLISDNYRSQLAEKHNTCENFGISGQRWAHDVMELANGLGAPGKVVTVLDYGCGRGTLREAIWARGTAPFYLYEYDPAIEGKDHRPEPVDLVICTDVLEHIEPECLYAVLDDIRSLAKQLVFVTISTKPASKHLPDGRNAHLIVEPGNWWLPKIIERWRVSLWQDRGGECLFIGAKL